MDIVVVPCLLLLKAVISIAIVLIITDVILGWLLAANILNINNHFVYLVISSISRLSALMLDPVRKRIPSSVDMLDLSPLVVILLLTLCENIINRILIRF